MRRDCKEMATTVANDPGSYKICQVCGAIVDKAADTCPDCSGYRFDEDTDNVVGRALLLGARGSSAISHLDIME
ncbi:MAG: hypothetical protein IJE66_02700 [Akkermansia sp.]|nr:hypothetical protein [Akkermansia sp.]